MNLLRERNHWAVVIEVSNNDSEGRRASQSWGSPVCCCDNKPECKHILYISACVFTPMQFTLWQLDERNDSLCFCPDLSVHDGSGGDAAS